MKKQLFKAIAAIALSISSASALTINNSQTWTGAITMNQDIIIEAGGHLTMQYGTLSMGDGYKIHIEDGGQFTGLYGEVTSASGNIGYNGWRGFLIDHTPTASPTVQYAIYLWEFDVTKSHIAFDMGLSVEVNKPPGYNNREIIAYKSTFEDNSWHMYVSNDIGASIADLMTLSNSLINFDGCEFKDALHSAELFLIRTNDVRFLNCRFTGSGINSASTNVYHLYGYRTLVRNCTFSGEIAQHYHAAGNHDNLSILRSSFNLEPIGYDRIGVGTGGSGGATITNSTIDNCSFTASPANPNSIGIHLGGEVPSSMIRSTISDNSFNFLGTGTHLEGLSASNVIEKNSFRNCDKGTFFHSANMGVEIRCNTFANSAPDIHIGTNGTLQNQSASGQDNMNSFTSVGTGSYNIINDGPATFVYYYNMNPPAVIFGGNVNRIYTTQVYECEGSGSASKNIIASSSTLEKAVRIYPNPASTMVNYEIMDENIESVVLISMEGQIVAEIPSNKKGSIDVSNLTPGMYFLVGTDRNQVVFREKVSVQH